MRRQLLLLVSISLTSCAVEPSAASKARFEAAAAYSAEKGGQALLVIEDGHTVLEQYQAGGGKNTPQRIYSGTKAFWGLAMLEAEKRGILDLDEKASETLPEWQKDPAKAAITLRELMTFSAGVEPLPALHENEYPDRTAAALKARLVARPGRAFIYGPAALQVMHEVLRRKLAPQKITPTRFLERHVLSDQGLGAQRYLADKRGAPLLAAGFMLTARQWSRMGREMLDLPAAALQGSRANPSYAFGFWNNRGAGSLRARETDIETLLGREWPLQSWSRVCLCKDAPASLIACIGSKGQRIYVWPEKRLIIVRMGKGDGFRDAEFLKRVRWEASKD